jgi:hypothetical protein
MKTCSRCNTPKLESEFNKHSKSADGLYTWCRECHREWQREYIARPENKVKRQARRKLYKDKEALYNRRCKIKKKYGITLEEYDALETQQGGVCAICKQLPSDPRGYRLHVDHCHITGDIRGLLCSNCNAGLGRFKDSVERLQSAIEYLG